MQKEVFHIWPADETVTLTVFRGEAGGSSRPAVIVVPGGAYVAPSVREAEPVAERFAAMGYVGCVLRASTMYASHDAAEGEPNPHTVFPEPLWEMACAIRFLRERAADFGLAPEKIALMGFSAGGHLCANYANYWNSEDVRGANAAEEIRPNACVLCYAATKLTNVRGGAMLRAVFGPAECYEQAAMDVYDGSLHVNAETPPTFLWHTVDDQMVSVQQSYAMAKALEEAGVSYELHVFSSGPHASGLAQGLPAQCWPTLADAFLRRIWG